MTKIEANLINIKKKMMNLSKNIFFFLYSTFKSKNIE